MGRQNDPKQSRNTDYLHLKKKCFWLVENKKALVHLSNTHRHVTQAGVNRLIKRNHVNEENVSDREEVSEHSRGRKVGMLAGEREREWRCRCSSSWNGKVVIPK